MAIKWVCAMCGDAFIQILPAILGVIGTWLLAFGLRIRRGRSKEVEKQDPLTDGQVVLSDVTGRPGVVYSGLALITFAGLIQIWLTIACSD